MMVEQIVFKNDYERQALELLKRQTYAHAKRFETRFLTMTGLLQDMNQAFTAIGWENFADIVELGLHLLTMEFLMSLTIQKCIRCLISLIVLPATTSLRIRIYVCHSIIAWPLILSYLSGLPLSSHSVD